MQMQSVETSAGTAICAAPSRMASCEVVALFEVALDVFDGDGGVVDEDADGEREAAEGHDVDGLADEAEHDDRGENRERNGDGDDDGGAPAAEEEQDHQAGERGGDDGFADDAVDGAADEDRLIADGLDLELRTEEWSRRCGSMARDAVDDARAWRRCRI